MNIITYTEIGLSILLAIAILLQQKGEGLGSSIGGGGMMEYSTRRGAEKAIFYATIVIAVLFFGLALARLLI